jgi:hypothetical protein
VALQKKKNAPPRPRAAALPVRVDGEADPRRPRCMEDCMAVREWVESGGRGARARGGVVRKKSVKRGARRVGGPSPYLRFRPRFRSSPFSFFTHPSFSAE